MTFETATAALRKLRISDERPNISTNALLGVIAAEYGIVAGVSSASTDSGDPASAPSSDQPWWNYVLCCLDCLRLLYSALQSESEKPKLSLHQTNMIRERLEFVVALGLYPHLDEGVGLPMSSRLYSAEQFMPPSKGFCADRVRLIIDCMMGLYDNAELRPTILPNFLHDLLVGLLTLSFCPQVRGDRLLTNRYQSRLRRLTTCGTPPVRDVIREVFVIQGSFGRAKSKLSHAPNWLRFACSQVLTKQIEKRSDGVLPLVLGFFDFAGPQGREAEKCSAIAEVVVRPPKSLTGPELDDHWKRLTDQIIPMIDQNGDPLLIRFAISFVNAFAKTFPEKTTDFIVEPLFGAEITKLNSYDDSNTGNEILSSQEIHNLFQRLQKFVNNSFDLCTLVINSIARFLPLVFFTIAHRIPNTTPVLSLACGILSSMTPESGCERLIGIVFDKDQANHSNLFCLHSAEDESMSVMKWNGLGPRNNRWGVEDEQIVDAIEQILGKMPSVFQGRFFIVLLEKLRELIIKEAQPEIVISQTHQSTRHRPDLLLSILSLIASKFPECCISQPDQVIEMAKETLIRCQSAMQLSYDEVTTDFMQESISIALGLVTNILVSSITEPDESKKASITAAFSSVLPLVSEIAESHSDLNLRQLASDLRVALATHGYVGVDAAVSGKQLIEEVTEPMGEFVEAIKDASSSAIPIRGHALIVLCRAVEEKKKEVNETDQRRKVLDIFLEAIGHSDSYIYLPAVRGLTALAETDPKSMLPYLLDRLTDVKTDGQEEEAMAEYRLKLGEAVMRCVRNLGETVPQYRDRLLNVFLARSRLEHRPMLRAAAVSNLAEVCRLLRYSLHTCLHEVFNASANLLERDDAAEVRSAAAYLLLSIIRGVDKDMWKIIGGEGLRDVYRLLRRREGIEKDEVVHKMILLVCNEFDDLIHEYFNLKNDRPVKEIRIL